MSSQFAQQQMLLAAMMMAAEPPVTANTQEIALPGSAFFSSRGQAGWSFPSNRPQIDASLAPPGQTRYLRQVFVDRSNGRFNLQIDPTITGNPSQADLSEQFENNGTVIIVASSSTLKIEMSGNDISEPYTFIPTNSAESIAFYNSIRTQSNVSATLTLSDGAGPSPTPDPPTPTNIAEFTLNAVSLGSGAAGRFGGLNWQFTHEGQAYTITYCFTHGNGIQMRFATNAQALAFIAADFEVDLGISGAPTFRSSQMSNRADVNWGQYAAYTGRFAANTAYTITIRE